MCVFFPFILDIKFVGRTSLGHTGAEYHTGFSIHLLSAVRALIFLARRIQPFLSLVDREVEFCVLPGNDLIVLHPLGIFFFFFFFFSEKNPVLPESNSRPNVSEGYMVTSQLPGRPARRSDVFTGITRHIFVIHEGYDSAAGGIDEEEEEKNVHAVPLFANLFLVWVDAQKK